MEIYNTWQKPALEPTFGMPINGSSFAGARTLTCDIAAGVAVSPMAHVRLDAVRIKGVFWGSPAWSPPIS